MLCNKSIELGERTLSIETGRMAKQAYGSTLVRYGDTVILAAVVASKDPIENRGFFPLSVEYRERAYAAGKIPGGFFKREGRPSEKEVLSARLIDRPIRPLFPKDYNHEVQVVVTILSSDRENDADVLGTIGASAALSISEIPFDGPIAAVRIGRIGGQLIVNPTFSQLEKSDMNVIVAASEDAIAMVEGEAFEISEADLVSALEFGHGEIKKIIEMQKELVQEVGKEKQSKGLPNLTLPDYVILDPTLTMSLPKSITASTGMDALGQAIESYWSINSTDESKELARKAIKLILENLEGAVNNPTLKTRYKMKCRINSTRPNSCL